MIFNSRSSQMVRALLVHAITVAACVLSGVSSVAIDRTLPNFDNFYPESGFETQQDENSAIESGLQGRASFSKFAVQSRPPKNAPHPGAFNRGAVEGTPSVYSSEDSTELMKTMPETHHHRDTSAFHRGAVEGRPQVPRDAIVIDDQPVASNYQFLPNYVFNGHAYPSSSQPVSELDIVLSDDDDSQPHHMQSHSHLSPDLMRDGMLILFNFIFFSILVDVVVVVSFLNAAGKFIEY